MDVEKLKDMLKVANVRSRGDFFFIVKTREGWKAVNGDISRRELRELTGTDTPPNIWVSIEHPIAYPPARPDQGLPGAGKPDQGLPPGRPDRPDQGLPPSAGRPDQGLPSSPGHPDNDLPIAPVFPEQGLPGEKPSYPSGQPVPPPSGSTKPVPPSQPKA